MNLLAHALLSPAGEAGVMVGNLAADWIKGRVRRTLREDLQRGIALHRRIDGFTDMHAGVARCGELLHGRWGRYAPVLVDILFDHVLSERWGDFCVVPREVFIGETYAVLRGHVHLLPERARHAAEALLADDWLTRYGTVEGIAWSLRRLSARLQHGVELAPAVEDYAAHRAAFEAHFAGFFPELRRHVAMA